MSYIIEGIILGLGLAVSLGPIFVALTEASIDRGVKAGLTVGVGIWLSDIIIILLFFNFIYQLKDTIESDSFIYAMGLSGAVVLFLFGIFMIIKKPTIEHSQHQLTGRNYFGYLTKGFLVNTINPFTFIYWGSVISTYVIARKFSTIQTTLLLSTIMFIIILSDTFKVYLADRIRQKLTPESINKVFNFSGLLLILFSLYMTYRVI